MQLPSSVQSFFWDTPIEHLDKEKNKKYIIERVIEYGQKEDITWLEDIYDKDTVINVIKESKRISQKSANAMALRFNILKKEIQCLIKPSTSRQHRF